MPSTSLIDPAARIGEGVQIGQFCVIGADVQIGAGCKLGHHVVIHEGTVLGDGCRVDDHASLGKQPMKAAASSTTAGDVQPPAQIGAGVIVGTGAVIYAGCTIGQRVLVADLATVRENVSIGERTIIGRGVAVENHCQIGARCKLETNVYITAYSTVEDDCFIAPGVLTSNDNFAGRTAARFDHFAGVTVRRGGRLGVGAVVLPGRTVGPDAFVAAGSVLTKDAAAETIVAGVPARPLRPVSPEQLLAPDA